MNRMFTNICTDNLNTTKDFYCRLFDFTVAFDSDWFIHLVSKDQKFELGIIKRNHELVPIDFQTNPQGFYLTFVVDDVDTSYEAIKEQGWDIVQKPTDTFYGQRRLLLKDPNGALLDISSPIPDFGSY